MYFRPCDLTSKNDDLRNPLISPLFAPDDLLVQLPPDLVIISAGLDPLVDDSVRFVDRLKQVVKSAVLTTSTEAPDEILSSETGSYSENAFRITHKMYDFLPHGFLNYAMVVPLALKAKNDTTTELVAMFRRHSIPSTIKS